MFPQTLLEDVLSPFECEDLINRAQPLLRYVDEARSEDDAAQIVTIAKPRNYQLAVVHDPLSELLYRRIVASLPSSAQSLNPRLRVLRYGPGEDFPFHFDLSVRHETLESLITVIAYLNDDFVGGETSFDAAAVAPRRGSVLLFDHRIWHAGKPIKTGIKYVLRTDVMFPTLDRDATLRPPPSTTTPRATTDLALSNDLRRRLDTLGLLDCTLDALRAPGRAALAAMLGDDDEATRLVDSIFQISISGRPRLWSRDR